MSEIEKIMADQVLQEARDSYYKIKSIYDATGYNRSYKLGMFWEDKELLPRIINSGASALETIRLIQNSSNYSIPPADPVKEKMVDWYIAYLMQCGHDISNLDSSIQESHITDPALCVTRGDRILTPDFLERVIHYLEIQKHCSLPKSKPHIVELGGGSGNLARTLKLFMPNMVYVDIDIPKTLYFAYIFLRLNFPDAKTLYVTDPSQLKDDIQQFDFVFVPTMFAECILPYQFDLFCNTASLGEMPNPTIRYWMSFIQDRLKVRYFFGLNRFLNVIDLLSNFEQKRLGENECSVLFDAKWKILCWQLDPPFAWCPYEEYHSVPQNLEIIAERLPDTLVNESGNQLRSQQVIEELMDEDWIRWLDKEIYPVMRSRVLANDLTMSGTLFKIWESIRLHPNKTNVAMMLIYLERLTKKNYPFEEWFYYRNSLGNLLTEDMPLRARTKLADASYEYLWKRALALTIYHNPFNIQEWGYHIIRFLPSVIRFPLLNLRRAVRSKFKFIP